MKWLNLIVKNKVVITIVSLFILCPVVVSIILVEVPWGFLEHSDRGAWITFYGSMIGGSLALIGVWWTLKKQEEVRAKENIPVLFINEDSIELTHHLKFNSDTNVHTFDVLTRKPKIVLYVLSFKIENKQRNIAKNIRVSPTFEGEFVFDYTLNFLADEEEKAIDRLYDCNLAISPLLAKKKGSITSKRANIIDLEIKMIWAEYEVQSDKIDFCKRMTRIINSDYFSSLIIDLPSDVSAEFGDLPYQSTLNCKFNISINNEFFEKSGSGLFNSLSFAQIAIEFFNCILLDVKIEINYSDNFNRSLLSIQKLKCDSFLNLSSDAFKKHQICNYSPKAFTHTINDK